MFSTTVVDVAVSVGEEQIEQFLWLVVMGGFVCFAMAWGIGANDVANAFATSVGARAITLKQATVIAGIFEFIGAVGLGASVTSTVRKGIIDNEAFKGEEDILLLGMFCALLSAALWLALATKYSLPVSTTQTVVGAIAGFAICAKGVSSINWIGDTDEDGNLEKFNGVLFIALFWFASPFFAAVASMLIFMPIRSLLLRRDDAYRHSLRCWPVFVWLVVFIMVFFLLEKGLKRIEWDVEDSLGATFGITMGAATIVAIAVYFALIKTGVVERMVERTVGSVSTARSTTVTASPSAAIDVEMANAETEKMSSEDAEAKETEKTEVEMEPSGAGKLKSVALHGLNVDIHDDLGQMELDIHANAEKFDPKVERSFAWLQVCTAALCIFAHGSNDVANAVAPFAAMVALYQTGAVSSKVEVYEWILVIGACGMVFGLSTYGYKIMKCLGVKMAPMTCSRGYSIELASSSVVILASYYGFPTSTTHAQVGATVGIGLVELSRADSKLSIAQVVNWKLLAQVLFGWVLTLLISGLTSAVLFSLLAYSPSLSTVQRH